MNAGPVPTSSGPVSVGISRKRIGVFIFGAVVVIAPYSSVLRSLLHFLLNTDLQQHVALIPFVSGYLIWRDRHVGHFSSVKPSLLAVAVAILVGTAAVVMSWKLGAAGLISQNDVLSLYVLSLLIFLLALALLSFGWLVIKPHLFAVCFLIFAVPLPEVVVHGTSVFLQHASADAAQGILQLSGTPVNREGLQFHIPGLDFVVAEECSGFRATFVLFILSLAAGYLLLEKRSHKILLTAAVLPIAIVRNGIRIAVITWLTSHVNPHVIDSPLHHQGGPLFFLMGLVPFLLLLWWLCCRETKSRQSISPRTTSVCA